MKVLVLGATGGTGRQIVTQARDAGHEVTAFDRHAAVSMAEAMNGQDAVISAIGRGRSLKANKLMATVVPEILSGLKAAGVRRVIFMSSLGVGASYDDSPFLAKLFFSTLLRGIYADKLIGERFIQATDLDWTIVKPSQLTDGPLTGKYRVGERLHLKGMPQISRADTAQFMLKQVSDATFLRKIVLCSY